MYCYSHSWHVIIRLCYLVQSHEAAQPPVLLLRKMMLNFPGCLRCCVLRSWFRKVLHETQYDPPHSKTCLENPRKNWK